MFELAKIQWDRIDDVIVSSVVPEADFHIKKFCEKYLKKTPLMVGLKDVPIKVVLDMPGEVGADRLVNAVAVTEFYKTPAVVVDFGTATTFDVIDVKEIPNSTIPEDSAPSVKYLTPASDERTELRLNEAST